MKQVINFFGLKIGWLACVLGAAYGLGWLGPLVVLGLVGLHVQLSGNGWREVRIILTVALFGSFLDTLLAFGGAFSFAEGWTLAWLSPLWMVALWCNFATSLNVTMGWLKGRYLLSAVVGAIGGLMAYGGGAKLGALTLNASWSLWAVGVEWAIALPCVVWLDTRLREKDRIVVTVKQGAVL